MENSRSARYENKGYGVESAKTDAQKVKRKRIVKKSEVTVHQWTFSTEVK